MQQKLTPSNKSFLGVLNIGIEIVSSVQINYFLRIIFLLFLFHFRSYFSEYRWHAVDLGRKITVLLLNPLAGEVLQKHKYTYKLISP
jgi:hypothetical protein